jgi:hypothetical protein
MVEESLEKIVGKPKTNGVLLMNEEFKGTISNAVLYFSNSITKKINNISFYVPKNDLKSKKNIISACNLNRSTEFYGVYNPDTKKITVKKVKVLY